MRIYIYIYIPICAYVYIYTYIYVYIYIYMYTFQEVLENKEEAVSKLSAEVGRLESERAQSGETVEEVTRRAVAAEERAATLERKALDAEAQALREGVRVQVVWVFVDVYRCI